MERLDFIRKLFLLYGKSTDKNTDLIRDYDLALSENPNIDWDKMYRQVEKSELTTLPNPKYLKSLFPKCMLDIEGQYKFNSGNCVLVLKDDKLKKRTGHNRFYVFDMWHVTNTLEEIRNFYKRKYGKNFISCVYYPDNFTIIGNKIYKTVIKDGAEGLEEYDVIE